MRLSGERGPDLAPDAARGRRFAVVAARFNTAVTARLLEGCLATLREYGAADKQISVSWVPGAFELPLAAKKLAKGADAVIALGCVIRGETPHDRYIAGEAARGLGQAALETGVPMIFGVLTPLNLAQAEARLGKGRDAALAAIEMAGFSKKLKVKGGT